MIDWLLYLTVVGCGILALYCIFQLLVLFAIHVLPRLIWAVKDLHRSWWYRLPQLRHGPNRRLTAVQRAELGLRLAAAGPRPICPTCDGTEITVDGRPCPHCIR